MRRREEGGFFGDGLVNGEADATFGRFEGEGEAWEEGFEEGGHCGGFCETKPVKMVS